MALPRFDHAGNLPAGVWPANDVELERRFAGKSRSKTRARICEAFKKMRHDIAHHGVSATQWVDGSFVTSKVNPADVDVVHFIDYDALKVLAQMNPAALEFVEEYIAANDRAMLKYHTHSFLVLSCGRSHGFHNAFEKARVYGRKWWGRTRDHRVKGFVRMRVGTRPPRISDATE